MASTASESISVPVFQNIKESGKKVSIGRVQNKKICCLQK